jgi:hypothetical protein
MGMGNALVALVLKVVLRQPYCGIAKLVHKLGQLQGGVKRLD